MIRQAAEFKPGKDFPDENNKHPPPRSRTTRSLIVSVANTTWWYLSDFVSDYLFKDSFVENIQISCTEFLEEFLLRNI
jgi:hypothetical protein